MKDAIGMVLIMAALFALFDPERMGKTAAQVVNAYRASISTD